MKHISGEPNIGQRSFIPRFGASQPFPLLRRPVVFQQRFPDVYTVRNADIITLDSIEGFCDWLQTLFCIFNLLKNTQILYCFCNWFSRIIEILRMLFHNFAQFLPPSYKPIQKLNGRILANHTWQLRFLDTFLFYPCFRLVAIPKALQLPQLC